LDLAPEALDSLRHVVQAGREAAQLGVQVFGARGERRRLPGAVARLLARAALILADRLRLSATPPGSQHQRVDVLPELRHVLL